MSCTDCNFKVGQIGAIVVIDLYRVDENDAEQVFDVSAATTLEVYLQKPDGTVGTAYTAAYAAAADGGNGTGTDGKIKFTTTLATDFDQSGDYVAEPYVVDPTTGFNGRTGEFRFAVKAILS